MTTERARRRRWRGLRPGRRGEEGMAMMIAMSLMLVLSTISTAIFVDDLGTLSPARHEQDYQAALEAADAGVEDYVNRLDNNTGYYTWTRAHPDSANPAFSGWVQVPQPTNATPLEWYTYDVNNTNTGVGVAGQGTAQTGIVHLIVTGAAGTNKAVVRTLDVTLRLGAFSSFLYFTDYETRNPALSGYPANICNVKAWQYRPAQQYTLTNPNGDGIDYTLSFAAGYGPDMETSAPYTATYESNGSSAGSGTDNFGGAYCSPDFIQFTTGDDLKGPIHTNDEFPVCGSPTFEAKVDAAYDQPTGSSVSGSSSYGGPGAWYDICGGSSPTFRGTPTPQPTSAANITMPTGNSLLATETAQSYGGGGCLYQGPVSITLVNGGTMNVSLASGSSVVSTGNACGPGSGVAIPPNGVIYDENNGSTSANLSVSGVVGGTSGNQVTLGSQTDITVTGSITYGDTPPGNDVVGLSASNNIVIQHGETTSGGGFDCGSGGSLCHPNIVIDAAMLALGSIYVYDYQDESNLTYNSSGRCTSYGTSPEGNLTVSGSLVQRYRGPVGTSYGCTDTGGHGHSGTTGYLKSYAFDSRLQYLQPPYFTAPTLPNWTRYSVAECAPQRTPSASSTC